MLYVRLSKRCFQRKPHIRTHTKSRKTFSRSFKPSHSIFGDPAAKRSKEISNIPLPVQINGAFEEIFRIRRTAFANNTARLTILIKYTYRIK